MTEKKMDVAVPAFLLCVDGYYLFKCFTSRKYASVAVGPYAFPKILGIALAVLCVAIIAKTLWQGRGEKSEPFRIGNPLGFVAAIVATALMILLWQKFGKFYLFGPIYTLGLLLLFSKRENRFQWKNLLKIVLITAGLFGFIYLTFQVAMGIWL